MLKCFQPFWPKQDFLERIKLLLLGSIRSWLNLCSLQSQHCFRKHLQSFHPVVSSSIWYRIRLQAYQCLTCKSFAQICGHIYNRDESQLHKVFQDKAWLDGIFLNICGCRYFFPFHNVAHNLFPWALLCWRSICLVNGKPFDSCGHTQELIYKFNHNFGFVPYRKYSSKVLCRNCKVYWLTPNRVDMFHCGSSKSIHVHIKAFACMVLHSLGLEFHTW